MGFFKTPQEFADAKRKKEELKREKQIQVFMKLRKLSREDAITEMGLTRQMLGISNNFEYKEKRDKGILCCPKCLSENVNTGQKGFSASKGILGGLTFGILGVAAGSIGSSKVKCTCLDCGHAFDPKYK